MKRIAVLLVLAVMTAGMATAETPNVGVVDMLKVSEGYERYVAARKDLEKKKAELQTIVDQEEQSILQLIEELEAIRATASQSDIGTRRTEIEKRDKELRDFVFQTNTAFRDELDTLQFRTKNEVESVVVELSQKMGLSLVLERNMTLFTSSTLDITDAVIAELNRRYRPLPAAQTGIGARPGATTTVPPTAFPAPAPAGTPGNRGWPFTSR